jgi:hypothetical protein
MLNVLNIQMYYNFTLSKQPPVFIKANRNLYTLKKNQWIDASFKVFTSLSSYNRKHILKVHHTYIHDGFINGSGNGGFSNVRLFFSLYKKFFNLLYSITYFNMPKLLFSSNVFREETCSLN